MGLAAYSGIVLIGGPFVRFAECRVHTRIVCNYLCTRVPRRTVNEAAGNV